MHYYFHVTKLNLCKISSPQSIKFDKRNYAFYIDKRLVSISISKRCNTILILSTGWLVFLSKYFIEIPIEYSGKLGRYYTDHDDKNLIMLSYCIQDKTYGRVRLSIRQFKRITVYSYISEKFKLNTCLAWLRDHLQLLKILLGSIDSIWLMINSYCSQAHCIRFELLPLMPCELRHFRAHNWMCEAVCTTDKGVVWCWQRDYDNNTSFYIARITALLSIVVYIRKSADCGKITHLTFTVIPTVHTVK